MKKGTLIFAVCAAWVMISGEVRAQSATYADPVNPSIRHKLHSPAPQQPIPPPEPPTETMISKQMAWIAAHKDYKSKRSLPDITHDKVEKRPCQNAEILSGMWAMIYYREDPPARSDRFNHRIKYQYLTFDASNGYNRIKSAVAIDDPKRAVMMLRPPENAQFAQKYQFTEKEDYAEIVFLSGKTAIARQSCSIVLKPSSQFKPGDMILTGYTYGGKTLLFELYRRWF